MDKGCAMEKPKSRLGHGIGVMLGVTGLLLVMTISAFAQASTAVILGTVKDASGGTVPGATVTVTNTDTGLNRSQPTSDDGSYRFNALPVGKYAVGVMKEGFTTYQHTGMTLVVDQQAVIDVVLQVGATGQTVTVTGEAPLVDTTSSEVGDVVDEQRVADLPLNGRNWADLTLMQNGVNQFPSNGRVTGAIGNTPGQTGTVFSANGADIHSNYAALDGANLMTFIGVNGSSGLGTNLGVDGIKEYKVITSDFSAEYGMVMGSQTTLVSKGGSNQWHGDVFEYLRNSALDARNYFDSTDVNNINGFGTNKSLAYPGKRIPPFRRNNFGGAFGGPIKKDKAFFWTTFEGVNQQLGNTITTTTLPMACFVNQNGVLQNQVPAIIDNDPATNTHFNDSAKIFTTGFGCTGTGSGTGKTITVQQGVLPFAQEFPQPNVFNSSQFNYTFPYIGKATEEYGQMRMDYVFSDTDSAFARNTVDVADQTAPTATSGSTGTGGSYAAYPGYELSVHSLANFATVGETHIISPTLLNNARFSYSRTVYQLATLQPDALFNSSRSLTGGNLLSDITPGNGVTAIGAFTFAPQGDSQDVYNLGDDIFWTKGKHALKFGTQIQRYLQYVHDCTSCEGTASFSNLPNFFSGFYSSIGSVIPGNNNDRQFRMATFGFYGQDDYRMLNHVTVNLGLRYEFATVPIETNPAIAYTLRNPLTDSTGTAGRMFLNPSLHDFSPRIGFAWDVTGKGTTSLRAGFGIYYDVADYGHLELNNSLSALPISASTSLTNSVFPPPIPFQAPFPPSNNTLPAPRTIQYNLKEPTMYDYTATLQQQLPWNMALSIGYVGSRGIHLYQIREANPTVPMAFNADGLPIYGCANASKTAAVGPGANGACSGTSFTPATCFLYATGASSSACPASTYTNVGPKPNTALGQVFDLVPDGMVYFNSLQTQLTKRVSQGLQMQFSYTFAKLLGTGANTASIENLNANNQLPLGFPEVSDRGPAGYDLRHSAHINFIYHLPTIAEQRTVGKLVNGWWFSSIISLQSGYPFTPSLSGDRENQNNTNVTERPNVGSTFNPNNVILGDPAQWFDPTQFALQPAGTLGNAGVGILRGPGFANVDFSAVKDTKVGWLGEAGNVEFRVEMFNIVNHPNFALPTTTVWSGTGTTPLTTPAGEIGSTGITPFAQAGKIAGVVNNSRQIQFALKVLF